MHRRRFLRSTSLAIPGWLLVPAMLESCKEKDWLADSSFDGEVAIIGAGAAGLYAAHLLNRRGISVKIYEASDQWGGRMQSLSGFADYSIELGAEEIHGSHSVLYSMAATAGASFLSDTSTDYAELDSLLRSETDYANDAEMRRVNELLNQIDQYSGADIPALAWGNVSGVTERVRHVFNAELANERGTSLSRIGMVGLKEEAERWSSGNDNYMLRDRTLLSLFEQFMPDALEMVQLNTPITGINSTGERIQLTSSSGELYACDRLIVTASVKVLQEQAIAFTPSLPASTNLGLQRIGMDRGLKVFLRFSQPIWPDGMGSLFTNGHVPEYWVSSAGRSTQSHVLCGLVCGEFADQFIGLGGDAIQVLMGELDILFNGGASLYYTGHHFMDWSARPWIRGAYSYPRPGTGNARELLTAPIGGRIFLAGEATHTGGHHASVHGAMETGMRAVQQILNS